MALKFLFRVAEPLAPPSTSPSHAFDLLRMSAALLLFSKLKIFPTFNFPTLQELGLIQGTLMGSPRKSIPFASCIGIPLSLGGCIIYGDFLKNAYLLRLKSRKRLT